MQQAAQGVLFLLCQTGKQVFLAVTAVVQRVAAAAQQPFQAVRCRHRTAVGLMGTMGAVIAVVLSAGMLLRRTAAGQLGSIASAAVTAGRAQGTPAGAAGADLVKIHRCFVHIVSLSVSGMVDAEDTKNVQTLIRFAHFLRNGRVRMI